MTFFSCFFVPYILIVSSDSLKSLLHRIQDVGSYFFSPYKVLYWKWQETWNSTKQLVFFVHEKLWLSKQKIKLRPIFKFKFKMRTCFFLTQQTYFFIFFFHLIIKIFALFSQTSKTYSIERLSSIIMYIQILTLVEAIVLLKNKMKIYII
jgi:hypothetical protein